VGDNREGDCRIHIRVKEVAAVVAPSEQIGIRAKIVKGFLGGLFCSLILCGCGLVRDAAVTSYYVATAPIKVTRWALKDRSQPPPQTAANTDIDLPGRPVTEPPPKRKPRTTATTSSSTGTRRTNTAPTSRQVTAQSEFPVAKPVPGKPGYVYSPFEPNKYVDVSGYASGSKVKDPYAQKIFVVP
jgi:hypothetical protein